VQSGRCSPTLRKDVSVFCGVYAWLILRPADEEGVPLKVR
jgi:hypothetical protein